MPGKRVKEDELSTLNPALAAAGPVVSGGNLLWVGIAAVIALLALGVAAGLVREVLSASQGTQKMQEIATAVQEGAAAYLRRQFRTLGVFVVVIFFVLLLLPADGSASAGAARSSSWSAPCSRG